MDNLDGRRLYSNLDAVWWNRNRDLAVSVEMRDLGLRQSTYAFQFRDLLHRWVRRAPHLVIGVIEITVTAINAANFHTTALVLTLQLQRKLL